MVNIYSDKQQLPVDMNRFWASSRNKLEFQKSFIEWLKDEYKDDIPIYLGEAVSNDITSCKKLS